MLVIPAIDLKDGRCVRLRQGDFREETVYSTDPPAMAVQWEDRGARLLHVVDLNGALEGQPKNLSVIEAIVKAVSVPVQVGGGIRDMETVRMYLSRGVERVVLGTAVLQDRQVLDRACKEFPSRILVSLDARGGKIAVRGWTSQSNTSATDLLRSLTDYALAGVVYTDIGRDGMLEGPNLSALREIVERSHVPIIASGGIARLEDLQAIKSLGPKVEGVIVGKALYDGKLDLVAALAAAG
ncbi:MAG TPA: 1-(5-phosphoribosyl)-5-[(5-phosphoribosylamino)methylideneamino]imidazole-4-carboxamide isomerase [Nitrospiraceae bacterium]|jgi:phosphoribosylformimino-5-aminoimidazole carboxamide ribotide isomerase|nr:1-(5-phosphoribosyl)-5-[(5-phosphoribosylamino)methylideneamino]imidazole-4-carboxamide isomerase [Nitrospiraceae bacterium]